MMSNAKKLNVTSNLIVKFEVTSPMSMFGNHGKGLLLHVTLFLSRVNEIRPICGTRPRQAEKKVTTVGKIMDRIHDLGVSVF